MQKLISSINQGEKYAKDLERKRNKQFFERVRRTGAYYNAKSWEEDYKRQLHGQKFMRQVTYERPKDWVDPFQEVPAEVKPKRGANREPTTITTSRRSGTSGGSHVSRMKNLRGKDGKGSGSVSVDGRSIDSKGSRGSSMDQVQEEEESSRENPSLSSRLLASVERTIRITTLHHEEGNDSPDNGSPSATGHHFPRPTTTSDFGRTTETSTTRESFTATANSLPSLFSHSMEGFSTKRQESAFKEVSVSIFCSLVDNRVLFITVDSVDEENPIHAEAQIDCNELMIVDIGDEDGQAEPPTFPPEPEAQELLALDLINEITLCVEDGESVDYEIVLPDPNRGGEEESPVPQPANEVTVEQAKQILEGLFGNMKGNVPVVLCVLSLRCQ